MARHSHDFQTIHSEGGLLPPDLLRRVLDPKAKLDGTRPEDYGLPRGERLNEVITQSWNRLRKHWAEFRTATTTLPEGEAGTGLTNDKWSLPLLRELGFGLLPTSAGPEINGRTYAINRFFGPVPIHLVGCGVSLDRRSAGVRGAAIVNPHGLVQEFLNRSDAHMWAMLSNGLRLRVLRDNQALSRQSFLEFDLEAMFAGEVYSDFVLLWLMSHATRYAPREGERPETCWLEQWTKLAEEQGTRALGDLRGGVEKALQILGEGFTSHPKNTALRDALRTGQVPLADFHGQLLRVVYRLIFLFVAEDRTLDGEPLLHPRDDSDAARTARVRYADHYSSGRLRELASKIKGSRHADLWRQFRLLVGALSGDATFATAREQLALPALGSFLWDPAFTAALNGTELTNYDFLEALRNLAFTRQGKMLRPVDYKNLGAEELGGVYESLLALTPQISADGARFTFAEFAGNERKTSGSYYTPDSLVQCLLDSALDPVVERAIKSKTGAEAEQAILALKVCDPAVGSGHFLVGAAHRLARHLARVRALAQGESEPSPFLYQHALRDVIGRCLYGVDVNPMAAELCRVSLWLEALEPGKPLSFLDHHIRVGNSLLGATPELIVQGIPDDAFNPIEGDDKKVCSALKKRNRTERGDASGRFAQRDMVHLMVAEPEAEYNSIVVRTRGVDEAPDDTIDEIQRKAEQFRRLVVSPEYQHARQVADAWCAAFVWKKQNSAPLEPITTDSVRCLEADANALASDQRHEVERLSGQYQFFHWYLAFPEVFAKGGFDCVLGNPPWEKLQSEEIKWFASGAPDIVELSGSHRKAAIAALDDSDPKLADAWRRQRRFDAAVNAFIKSSRRYPLTGIGKFNAYALFAETFSHLMSNTGRSGIIVPSGIATDDTTKLFFQDVVERKSLVSLFDFENRLGLFPEVDSRMKFCLFTFGRGARPTAQAAEFVFFAHSVDDLRDPERRFTLSTEDITLLNPNTRTCPIFRSRSDAEITKVVYRHIPPIEVDNAENPWSPNLRRVLNETDDSEAFLEADQLTFDEWRQMEYGDFQRNGVIIHRVYEAKMMWQFDHRFATYREHDTTDCDSVSGDEHANSGFFAGPRYWYPADNLRNFFDGNRIPMWFLVFRRITNTTNERTMVFTILPQCATGTLTPLVNLKADARQIACFLAEKNSFAFDYIARQKISGTDVNLFKLKQLPSLEPKKYQANCVWDDAVVNDWLLSRVLELIYTAWDLEPFARACGWSGPPFRWDEERRFLLRCDLDAAFFHLYLPTEANGNWCSTVGETSEDLTRLKASFPTPRDAVVYIMETFPIVQRKDEAQYGTYRTKDTILALYDALAEAQRVGQHYQSHMNPLPGPPVDVEGRFISMYQLDRDNWPAHMHPPHSDWDDTLLDAWFRLCQRRWDHIGDGQVFPWDGREAFVYALIPYLVQERIGEKFEFYRDAALLVSRPHRCETFLLDDALRKKYSQAMRGLDWLQFPDEHRIRPRRVREALQGKQIIRTDAKTGATTVQNTASLPPLPTELQQVLPLILKAADNLDKAQRGTLEHAEVKKLALTKDELAKEFEGSMVA